MVYGRVPRTICLACPSVNTAALPWVKCAIKAGVARLDIARMELSDPAGLSSHRQVESLTVTFSTEPCFVSREANRYDARHVSGSST